MTTTSEKILSEMERMGIRQNTLCDKMRWQYQTFHRRMAPPGKFKPHELQLIADSMNALQPYLEPTNVEALTGDVEPPDTLFINGYKYEKVKEQAD